MSNQNARNSGSNWEKIQQGRKVQHIGQRAPQTQRREPAQTHPPQQQVIRVNRPLIGEDRPQSASGIPRSTSVVSSSTLSSSSSSSSSSSNASPWPPTPSRHSEPFVHVTPHTLGEEIIILRHELANSNKEREAIVKQNQFLDTVIEDMCQKQTQQEVELIHLKETITGLEKDMKLKDKTIALLGKLASEAPLPQHQNSSPQSQYSVNSMTPWHDHNMSPQSWHDQSTTPLPPPPQHHQNTSLHPSLTEFISSFSQLESRQKKLHDESTSFDSNHLSMIEHDLQVFSLQYPIMNRIRTFFQHVDDHKQSVRERLAIYEHLKTLCENYKQLLLQHRTNHSTDVFDEGLTQDILNTRTTIEQRLNQLRSLGQGPQLDEAERLVEESLLHGTRRPHNFDLRSLVNESHLLTFAKIETLYDRSSAYELHSDAGRTVTRYKRREDGQLCILKQLSIQDGHDAALRKKRIERELLLLNRHHKHPLVVDVTRIFQDEHLICIEMPCYVDLLVWLKFEDLSEEFSGRVGLHSINLLRRNHVRSREERLHVFRQIVDVVSYLHSQRCEHRDLKHNNVVLDVSNGRATVKLIDFGISKLHDGYLSSTSLETGRMGNARYLPPEILLQNSRLKAKNYARDAYALGIMLYEFFCDPKDVDAVQRLHPPNAPSPSVADILPESGEFCGWIRHATLELLQRDPQKRPSMIALQHQFAKFMQESGRMVSSNPVDIAENDIVEIRSLIVESVPDLEEQSTQQIGQIVVAACGGSTEVSIEVCAELLAHIGKCIGSTAELLADWNCDLGGDESSGQVLCWLVQHFVGARCGLKEGCEYHDRVFSYDLNIVMRGLGKLLMRCFVLGTILQLPWKLPDWVYNVLVGGDCGIVESCESQGVDATLLVSNLDALKTGFFECIPQGAADLVRRNLSWQQLKLKICEKQTLDEGIVRRDLVQNLRTDHVWQQHIDTRNWLENWIRSASSVEIKRLLMVMTGYPYFTSPNILQRAVFVPGAEFCGGGGECHMEVNVRLQSEEQFVDGIRGVLCFGGV